MRWPQRQVGRLPDGIHEAVSRVLIPLMPFESPGCCSPSCSPVSQHTALIWSDKKDLVSLVVRKNWSLWWYPTQLGELDSYSHAHVFPCGRTHRPGSSLGSDLCHFRGLSETVPLNLFNMSNFRFFSPSIVLELLCRLLGFHNVTPTHSPRGDCLNWCSLGGR